MRMSYRERRKRNREISRSLNSIKLVIPGNPIAQKRGRATIRGKHAGIHSIQQEETGDFKVKALEQYFGKPLEGALNAKLEFYFPRPKGHYGTGRNAGKLKPSAPAFHTKKPDVDNLIKFSLDCLNKIAYLDDDQIVRVVGEKFYADECSPRTEITIRAIE